MLSDFKILIVDDSELMRVMLRQSLSSLGFTSVEEASDGYEALRKIENALESAAYAAVFTDWNMPRMSGLDLLVKLKSTEKTANLPVVIVSSERDSASVIRALEAGAHDFLKKPLSAELLQTKLRKILLADASEQDV